MLKNLLLYRMAVINLLMATVFGYMVADGWAARAYNSDPTGLVVVIFGLFLLLLGSTFVSAYKTAQGLNAVKRGLARDSRKTPKRLVKIKHIEDGGTWLAYLGLIGTVIGFLMSMQGVGIDAFASAHSVKTMAPQLLAGIGVALYTTLAGAFFGLWTEFNYRMLHTAVACLVADESDE